MSEELKQLILQYRESHARWRSLVEQEGKLREKIIAEFAVNGEPDNLRELLEEKVDDNGLRAKQSEALNELKTVERRLFTFNFEVCEDPDLKRELEHLAQDYAARITWLMQYLEPLEAIDGPLEDEVEVESEEA